MTTAPAAVRLTELSKRYDATVALNKVTLEVAAGSIHALLGENGAGKSTVVKILAGLTQPDSGVIEVMGEAVRLRTPLDAHKLGVQTAFQEMTLLRDLTITQNVLLPYEPTRAGLVRRRRSEELVAEIFERFEVRGIDPRRDLRELDLPTRQMIEIVKAISRGPRVLLLDEPTSALSRDDVEWLGRLIQRLHAEGVTIVLITHRMPEVRLWCDRLSVLRNGQHVGTVPTDSVSDDAVIQMVIGRSIASIYPPKGPDRRNSAPAPALAGRNLSRGNLHDASFELWPGEILGIAGLQGMGQLDLFLGLFGVEPFAAGEVAIDGQAVTLASPGDGIEAHIGISLVPEDRKSEGLFPKMSGGFNVSLPSIERFTRFGIIDVAAERRAVDGVLERIQVQPRALYTRVSAFSGGNQQKIAIGKWLLSETRVLLLYDPTRGVDVGTKHEIYLIARQFAAAGGAVLFYSTEVPELVNLCDRVLAIYRGRTVRELMGEDLSDEAIMRAVLGGALPAQAAE
jgi:ribose transport system ATP-binding protein